MRIWSQSTNEIYSFSDCYRIRIHPQNANFCKLVTHINLIIIRNGKCDQLNPCTPVKIRNWKCDQLIPCITSKIRNGKCDQLNPFTPAKIREMRPTQFVYTLKNSLWEMRPTQSVYTCKNSQWELRPTHSVYSNLKINWTHFADGCEFGCNLKMNRFYFWIATKFASIRKMCSILISLL
jgi:hypothetical protein